MHFLRPFQADDYLLHHMVSPSASGGRGLTRGMIYNRAGELVALTSQESLMRNLAKL
jgi:acyl-CoA thioesterase-2